jgi:methylmalonyl-CoA decarboxylase
MPLVLATLDEHVGTITINRPERRNALSKAVLDEMMGNMGELRQKGARVLIVRAGKGSKVWSAGYDISELPKPGEDPLTYYDSLLTTLRFVQHMPLPVIAMIEGGVWGGACDLAMSCDILIGCPSASFTVTPAKVGIPYNASGILHFINVVGTNTVKELFFTAQPLDADRALRVGILNHLVPTVELEGFTLDLAKKIAKNSPLSITAAKEQVNLLASAHPLAPSTFERIQALRQTVYESKDYAEGVKAFWEKREPHFEGK